MAAAEAEAAEEEEEEKEKEGREVTGFGQYYNSPVPVTTTPASDNKHPPPPLPPSDKKPWHQSWTVRILIIAVAIIIIVAIIVGAVVGTQAAKDGESDSPSAETNETGTSADDLKMGVSYNATFTMYGTDDGSGGTNCNTKATSCGFYSDVSISILVRGANVRRP